MEAINTVVSIYLKGTSVGSRMARGMLSHTMDTLFVRISPKKETAPAEGQSEEANTTTSTTKNDEPTDGNGKDKEKLKDEPTEEKTPETEGKEEAGKQGKGFSICSDIAAAKPRARTKSMVHKKDCNLVFAHLCTLSNPAANKG